MAANLYPDPDKLSDFEKGLLRVLGSLSYDEFGHGGKGALESLTMALAGEAPYDHTSSVAGGLYAISGSLERIAEAIENWSAEAA